MNALRQAWATIARQLGQLSGKDRALIGSLVVTGVLALVLVALWSSKPAMEPLLPDMPPGDQAAAEAALKDADIEHSNRGGRVYVPPDKKLYALAYLQQAGKMPENTQSLFAALSKGNWMMSRTDSDRLANAALCDVLGGVIAKFKGVERATVIIDTPEAVGFGSGARKPTASIGVMLKPGKVMDPDMVDAIAGMVAGAKGLEMRNIRVIDQRRGEQFIPRVSDPLGTGYNTSGDYLTTVARLEDRIQRKIADMVLRMDPLSIVTVSMQADNTAKRTTTTSMLPDGKGSVAVLENTSEDKQGDRSAPQGGGQPGVVSNVTADATGGAGAGGAAGTSHSNKKEVFKVGIGQKVVDEFAPGGMPTRVSVMVSLSREYIVNLVRTKAASAGGAAGGAGGGAGGGVANQPNEPTQAEIDGAFLKEKERLEKDLASLVQTIAKEPDASNLPRVTVSMIPVAQLGLAGMGSGMGGMPGASMASVGATAGLVGQLATGPVVRTAFLGLLAFVALGMMLMLVRKSSKPQNLPSPEELAGLPPVIDAGDDVVGEADEGATAMVGIELGESQIKTKKMLESIEELVKKNPNDGANLLNRWLNVER